MQFRDTEKCRVNQIKDFAQQQKQLRNNRTVKVWLNLDKKAMMYEVLYKAGGMHTVSQRKNQKDDT